MIKVVAMSNMATPKLAHLHCMEMHTILLYPWNSNFETNISMQKGLRLEKCNKVNIDIVRERKRTIMSTIGLKELKI
jgi:hypothetical protein